MCGIQTDSTVITSMGNKMHLEFRSDVSKQMKGFFAKYKTVGGGCGGFRKGTHGIIMSSNYPQNYDPNDDCEWLIEVAENHVVRFSFEDFDVEPHSNCSYDYVALYDGNSTSDPLLLKHCGKVNLLKLLSKIKTNDLFK